MIFRLLCHQNEAVQSMDEKEIDEVVDTDDVAIADVKANATDKHASTNPADMDPIDYVSLLMEQEHR